MSDGLLFVVRLLTTVSRKTRANVSAADDKACEQCRAKNRTCVSRGLSLACAACYRDKSKCSATGNALESVVSELRDEQREVGGKLDRVIVALEGIQKAIWGIGSMPQVVKQVEAVVETREKLESVRTRLESVPREASEGPVIETLKEREEPEEGEEPEDELVDDLGDLLKEKGKKKEN